jgi:hypothetical protein
MQNLSTVIRLSGAFAICFTTFAEPILPVSFDASVIYYSGDTPIAFQGDHTLGPAGSASYSACLVSTAVRTVCGTAFASPGRLGTRSSLVNTDPTTIPAGSAESSNAAATFTDVLTITGLAPGTYSLLPRITVHGTGAWDKFGYVQTIGLGINQFGPDGSSMIYSVFPDATQSSYTATFDLAGIAFQPGTPFNLKLTFGTAARIYSGPAAVQNTSVTADFLSTMVVSGLEIRDPQGQLISFSNLNLQSESGTTYTSAGVVPEPSSMLLVSGGVLAGLLLRRRQKIAGK